jgi:hypothetical protein
VILAEFGGTVDAAVALTRMAEEILYWRSRMKQIADVVAKVHGRGAVLARAPALQILRRDG